MTTVIDTVAQSLSPDPHVALFRLDATSVGGAIYYFCQSAFEAEAIDFGGVTYNPADIEFRDMMTTGVGSLPTPKIILSNTNGVAQLLVNTYGDLLGCVVQRVRTFKRFLDGQAEADPSAYYGPDTYLIERKVSETPFQIEWELSTSFDQEGKMLPGRQVIRDICLWRYRVWEDPAFDYSMAQCPYTGTNYFDAEGNVVVDPADDRPGRRISNCCELRFGTGQPLPFGGFPGVGRIRP